MWKELLQSIQSIRRINIYCYKFYMLVRLTNLFTMPPKCVRSNNTFASDAVYVCVRVFPIFWPTYIAYRAQHQLRDSLCFQKSNLKFTHTRIRTHAPKLNWNRIEMQLLRCNIRLLSNRCCNNRTTNSGAVAPHICFICFFCPAKGYLNNKSKRHWPNARAVCVCVSVYVRGHERQKWNGWINECGQTNAEFNTTVA